MKQTNKKNKRQEISCDYYKIKQIDDCNTILNLLRNKTDVYLSFNRIMTEYEEGKHEIEIILVCDIHKVVIQQLALFSSVYSIEMFYIRPDSDKLKSIFKQDIKVIGIKKNTELCERIKNILNTTKTVEIDIYS